MATAARWLLSGDLARLADSDAFALACNLYIGVRLTTNDDIVFNQLDRVILAVVCPVLGRKASKLLRVQNLIAIGSATTTIAFLRRFL